MEAKDENNNVSSMATVKADEAPDSFRAAPITENTGPGPLPGPTVLPAAATSASPVSMVALESVLAPRSAPGSGSETKKKRGRPRKYGPDGKLALTLSPMPISSSIPLTGDFSAWKRGRGRPLDNIKKSYKFEYETPGKGIYLFLNSSYFNVWSYSNYVYIDTFKMSLLH